MESQKNMVIQKLYRKQEVNPKHYAVSLLYELEEVGYIKTWKNEQNQIIYVGRGVNFDNALKYYLK